MLSVSDDMVRVYGTVHLFSSTWHQQQQWGFFFFNESGTANCEITPVNSRILAMKTAHATSLSELLHWSVHTSFFFACLSVMILSCPSIQYHHTV